MDGGKGGGAAKVKIKAQGLVDGEFHGGCTGATTEGEGDSKAGQADDENGDERAGKHAAQHGPFKMAGNGGREEAE